MRAWLAVYLVFLLLGLLPKAAPAQTPPTAGPVPDLSPWARRATTDGSFAGGDQRNTEETSEATSNPWALDILVGFPLGVRLQHTIGPTPDGPFILEGIAGLFFINPAAGVGARVQFMPFSGTHNALVVSPGIDVYIVDNWLSELLGGRPTVTLLSGNVDIAVRQFYASGADGQSGLELGALANPAKGSHRVVPEATFFVGWRF